MRMQVGKIVSLSSFLLLCSAASTPELDLISYAPYIAKLHSFKLPPEEIALRVEKRQAYDRWAIERSAEVRAEDPQHFVSKVSALEISPSYKDRLVKTYSLCIDSYRQPKNREFMRKITVEKKFPNFGEQPQDKDDPSPPISSSRGEPIYHAYNYLVEAAKEIVAERNLDEWQQACLSKCVGDEMVEYSAASQHPLRAAFLFVRSFKQDGPVNLSSKYGVCTTYARITKAIAQELGFGSRVRIGSKGKHYFNQIKIEGKWYHFHPLRKYGKDCSFFPYS